MDYIYKPIEWYSSDEPLAIQYRKYMIEQIDIAREQMNIPNICCSCIHFYDESTISVCTKNDRWFPVEYDHECDIDSWEGI